MYELRPHQLDFIKTIEASKYKGLIAYHSMGLGKTFTTLSLARRRIGEMRAKGYLQCKFLVLCPKSALTTWKSECAKLTPDIAKDMILVPYSQLKRAIRSMQNTIFPIVLIGLDECHYLKTPDTDRIKDFAQLLKAIAKSKHGDVARVMPMTGTPIPNNAAEIYTMWALCTADNLEVAADRMIDEKSFGMWRASFTNERQISIKHKAPWTSTGYSYSQATTYEGVANEDMMHKLLSPIIHYVRVEDCLDLPEMSDIMINLSIPDDKLLENANVEKEDAYMSQLRTIAELKTPYMIEWVDNFIKLNEQLVVFSLFTTPLRVLAQRFPKQVRLITGAETQAERDGAIKNFQAGKLRIIAMSYGAGAESLNLQNARHTFYLNYPWNDDKLSQARARTHRSGQKNKTFHHFMLSGEHDQACLHRVLKKRAANETFKELLLAGSANGQPKQEDSNLFHKLEKVASEIRGYEAEEIENKLTFGGLL